jgi:hypothetical protein
MATLTAEMEVAAGQEQGRFQATQHPGASRHVVRPCSTASCLVGNFGFEALQELGSCAFPRGVPRQLDDRRRNRLCFDQLVIRDPACRLVGVNERAWPPSESRFGSGSPYSEIGQ